MKAYYLEGANGTVQKLYLETYDKLSDINLTNYIEQDVVIDTSSLNPDYPAQPDSVKIVDGVVVLKTEADYRQERIDKAETTIGQENTRCMNYQTGETDPRIDPNFYATIIVGYGMLKTMGIKTATDCPCCQANTDWVNTLWEVVWVDIKAKLRAGDEIEIDYATLMIEAGSTANPPHTFDECYSELS